MQGYCIGGAFRQDMIFDPNIRATFGKKGAVQDLIQFAPLTKST